jgi:hypothetical protein
MFNLRNCLKDGCSKTEEPEEIIGAANLKL